MKNTIVAATAAVAMAVGSAAMADDMMMDKGFYLGVLGGQGEISGAGLSLDGQLIQVKGGYNFNKYVGAELQVGQGDVDVLGVGLDYDAVSAFVTVGTDRTNRVRAYALLGKTNLEADIADDGATSTSYGAGLQFNATPNVAVQVEYKVLGEREVFGESVDATSTTIGVTYRF